MSRDVRLEYTVAMWNRHRFDSIWLTDSVVSWCDQLAQTEDFPEEFHKPRGSALVTATVWVGRVVRRRWRFRPEVVDLRCVGIETRNVKTDRPRRVGCPIAPPDGLAKLVEAEMLARL